jgi:ribosomal protein L11 methyltransferase
MAASSWRIGITVPAQAVPTFEAALDDLCEALSCFELPDSAPTPDAPPPWRLDGVSAREPDRERLGLAVSLAARAAGVAEPAVSVEREDARDWVAATHAAFPPFSVGRFHLRGSHVAAAPPAGALALVVDAATAFGSGEHPTTRGCLLALDAMARAPRRRPARVLDMGCGTGILALAAARAWRRPVLAVDSDAEAVRVTAANARRNGLSGCVGALRSDGFRDGRVAAAGPYDLILANILARPLCALSRPMAAALAPGGRLVLSGLLATQETRVLAAYRRQGLALERRYPIEEWTTLVLRRPVRG